MVRRKLTIPERWQAVGMHNGGFVRLMQHFRQTGNATDRPRASKPRKTTPRGDRLISSRSVQLVHFVVIFRLEATLVHAL